MANRSRSCLVTMVAALVMLPGIDSARADGARDSGVWEQVLLPAARTGHALTYDTKRRRLVLFGGAGMGETWEWDGRLWRRFDLPTAPSARADHAMVYDPTLGEVVLFGGQVGGVPLGDTWSWDGARWKLHETGAAPPPRFGHRMAHDPIVHRLVLFGGNATATDVRNDTWEWDGATGTWALIARAGSTPAGRAGYGLAFDAASGHVLLFGGDAGTGKLFNDTWLYSFDRPDSPWQQVSPGGTLPQARTRHTLASDGAHLVLVGGETKSSVLSDVQQWDGATRTWSSAPSLVISPAKAPLAAHAMTLDEATGELVVIGGRTGAMESTATDTVWRRGAVGGWTSLVRGAIDLPVSLQSEANLSAAFDPEAGLGHLVDSAQGHHVWDGSSWAAIEDKPPAPSSQYTPIVYASASKRVLMVQGGCAPVMPLSVLAWQQGSWQPVAKDGPPARDSYALGYDPEQDAVVVFGGNQCGASDPQKPPLFSETWIFKSGAWTKGPSGPSQRWRMRMAFSSVDHQLLLVGGQGTGTNALHDTWGLGASGWVEHKGVLEVERRHYGLVEDTTRHRMVLFGGKLQGGTLPTDTLEWTQSSWVTVSTTPAASSPELPGRSELAMFHDSVRRESVVYGGSEVLSQAARVQTWRYHARGGSCQADADCDTGHCVDAVCCEVAACGTCATCAGTSPGLCTMVTGGDDPDSCAGARTCDAAGVCGLKAARCRDTLTAVSDDGSPVSCQAYRCEQSACRTSCESVAQCAPGFDCDLSGRCVTAISVPDDGPPDGCGCEAAGARSPGREAAWMAAATLVFAGSRRVRARRRARRHSL